MSEGVARAVVPQFNLCVSARVVYLSIVLDTHVILARHVELANVECGRGMIDAAVGDGVAFMVVREVKRLTYLVRLEQGGIALGIDFRDFIFHGQHRHAVLTRHRTGLDDQPIAVDIHVATVLLVGAEEDVVVPLLDAVVQLVAHQPRGVVALQLHDDGKRVAQVVRRGQLAEGLAALHVATHHTALQRHAGLVPEHVSGNGLLPVVTQGVGSLSVDEVTIVHEGVPLLHHTHGVLSF